MLARGHRSNRGPGDHVGRNVGFRRHVLAVHEQVHRGRIHRVGIGDRNGNNHFLLTDRLVGIRAQNEARETGAGKSRSLFLFARFSRRDLHVVRRTVSVPRRVRLQISVVENGQNEILDPRFLNIRAGNDPCVAVHFFAHFHVGERRSTGGTVVDSHETDGSRGIHNSGLQAKVLTSPGCGRWKVLDVRARRSLSRNQHKPQQESCKHQQEGITRMSLHGLLSSLSTMLTFSLHALPLPSLGLSRRVLLHRVRLQDPDHPHTGRMAGGSSAAPPAQPRVDSKRHRTVSKGGQLSWVRDGYRNDRLKRVPQRRTRSGGFNTVARLTG